MQTKVIVAAFKELFPNFKENIIRYSVSEHNCVTFLMKNGREIIFSYNGPFNWKLETKIKSSKRSVRND